MAETKKLPKRSEIDSKYKWHIEDLYASDDQWDKDYQSLLEECKRLAAYEGRLSEGAKTFLTYMEEKQDVMKRFERLYVYANERYHEDTGNGFYQAMSGKAQTLALSVESSTVFEEPELLAIGKETIDSWFQKEEGMALYKRFFYELFRQQEHVRSKEIESILADVNDMAGDVSNIFSMFNNADVKFPSIKGADGEEIPVSHGRYTSLLENRDRNIRKQAFMSVYSQYGQFKNTLAATYGANVKDYYFFSKVRHYDSALAMSLDGGEIPVSVYTQLIDTVHDHMDLMYRYVGLRKKALGLDELHMYDLYAPMAKKVDKDIPFEQAKEIVKKGLAPLGEDYIKILSGGMDGGWVDVYENEGKRSGAYSW